MHSVLFVCTANVCRSPMAMGLWKAKTESESDLWNIASAGTWAIEGEPPAKNAEIILSLMGIDISGHRSRQVTLDILKSYRLILTMEMGHKEALRVEFPEIANRVYTLSEMIGLLYDIPDPIGGPAKEYQEIAREIDDILTRGYDRIKKLAEE